MHKLNFSQATYLQYQNAQIALVYRCLQNMLSLIKTKGTWNAHL